MSTESVCRVAELQTAHFENTSTVIALIKHKALAFLPTLEPGGILMYVSNEKKLV